MSSSQKKDADQGEKRPGRPDRWWDDGGSPDQPRSGRSKRAPDQARRTVRKPAAHAQAGAQDHQDQAEVDSTAVLGRWKVMRNAVIAVAILLGVLGLVSMYVMDESLPWDEDLSLPEPVGGRAPVAHDMLRQVEDGLIPLAGARGIVLESLSADIVDSYLRINSRTLDSLIAALAEPEWKPRHEAWRNDPLTREDIWHQVSVMKTLEAMLLQERGMELEAFGAAFDLMALGLRMQELEALPSYYIHGHTLYQGGALLLANLVNRTRLTTDQLMVLQAGLARMDVADKALQIFFRACYAVERQRMLARAFPATIEGEDEVRADPFFKPNATLRLFATSFRKLADEVPRAHFARSGRALDRLPARTRGLRRLLNSNWRGEAYFAERMRHYTGFYDQQTLLKTQRQMVLTLFALRRFHAIEGRLPIALAELVPEYIPELPIDPFDGEPIRYDARDAILRSVGSDLVDEGGWYEDNALAAPHEPTLFIRF